MLSSYHYTNTDHIWSHDGVIGTHCRVHQRHHSTGCYQWSLLKLQRMSKICSHTHTSCLIGSVTYIIQICVHMFPWQQYCNKCFIYFCNGSSNLAQYLTKRHISLERQYQKKKNLKHTMMTSSWPQQLTNWSHPYQSGGGGGGAEWVTLSTMNIHYLQSSPKADTRDSPSTKV